MTTEMTAPGNQGSRPFVVVGVDGSSGSKAALRWAADYAAAAGTDVHAVLTWHVPLTLGWVFAPGEQGLPERHASKQLEHTLDDVFGANRPAGLRGSVVEGHPVPALLAASEDASLLVVGSRGHGGFAAMLLGSVGAACTQHATCPVVIVRP